MVLLSTTFKLSLTKTVMDLPASKKELELGNTIYIALFSGSHLSSTSLIATGLVVKSPGSKQLVELQAKHVEVLGSCDAAKYPLAKTKLELEYLRTVAHLRPRTNTVGDL